MLILAGDIGGTNTRLCLAKIKPTDQSFTIIKEESFSSKKDSFLNIVKEFLDQDYQPEKACFALAGPVLNNKCTITNLSWPEIDAEKLQVELNIPQVTLINDFVAVAYNIVLEKNKDLLTLQSGEVMENAPIAIIGAGTGLGKAFAIPQGDSYEVFPTEGGHTNFAPDSQIQMELLEHLLSEGKVDTEAIVSGMGIVTIFKFLKEHKFPDRAAPLRDQIAEDILTQKDPAKAIATEAGKENPNFLCQKTMEIFIEAYGAAVGDMAVSFLPFGGIYIAGGIASQNIELMQKGKFMEAFQSKARIKPMLLAKIPVHIVCNTLSGLIGAVQYAMNKM